MIIIVSVASSARIPLAGNEAIIIGTSLRVRCADPDIHTYFKSPDAKYVFHPRFCMQKAEPPDRRNTRSLRGYSGIPTQTPHARNLLARLSRVGGCATIYAYVYVFTCT